MAVNYTMHIMAEDMRKNSIKDKKQNKKAVTLHGKLTDGN